MAKRQFIQRDISWLSFNARVLQEANDPTVPLSARIRFLGIFSNNSDEFFRVRVATLKRMIELSESRKKLNMHLEIAPQTILDDIQTIVLQQQNEFNRIWEGIELTIDKVKSTRSNQQNKYYWSGVVSILSTELGYSKDEIHDLLKYKFLKRTVIIGDSEETIMKSTTELTKSEFMDFIADIQLWAAELNINIPDPGTQIDLTL